MSYFDRRGNGSNCEIAHRDVRDEASSSRIRSHAEYVPPSERLLSRSAGPFTVVLWGLG